MKLSRRDILTELPFGNRTVTTKITGAALKAALENGVSLIETKAGRFPQLSGIVVTYDVSKPAGQRLVSAFVNNVPVDDAKIYTLGTNDYLLKGGDDYTSLRGAITDFDLSGNFVANDVIRYAEAQKNVSGKIDGRITLR